MLFVLFCRLARRGNVLGVYVLDTLTRTAFETLAATNTLAVINDRYVVYKYDCACRAITLTLAASNAACLALGHYVFATTFSRASNVHLGRNGHTFDKAFGASLDANSATTAKFGIDVSVAFAALD